ncbi:MAG: serine hydrolase [Acidobacteria bacterium]|nr:serine hydrolase [Acidobacteriota bacterium]
MDDHATLHITVRDLVTHVSGLPRHDLSWYNASISRAEAMSRLAHLEPNKDLRQEWQYQNFMFVVAGLIVERLTGAPWEDAVRARLFAPLGMKTANFSVRDMQKSADFALPHGLREKKLAVIPFRDIAMVGPAGSINASARDIAQWLRMHLSGGQAEGKRVLQQATVTELHTPVAVAGGHPTDQNVMLSTYALGWFADSYRGHFRVHHGGAIDGFVAHVGMLPLDGYGVAVFANREGTGLPEMVARTIFDRLLDLESGDWLMKGATEYAVAKEMSNEAEAKQGEMRIAGTKPSRAIEGFAGTYEHPGYGRIVVAHDKGALTLTYNGIAAPLEHWHYDVFAGKKDAEDQTFAGSLFAFRTALDGRVESLVAPFELLLDPIVFQRAPDPRLSDPAYLARFVGAYALGPQTVTMGLRGNVLTASLPGQPTYELVPEENDTFALKGLEGFRVAFDSDAKGVVKGARFLQPNGVFEAAKMP